MATAYQLDGVIYSIASHRDSQGHFATWKCMTCGTAGGKSGVYADEHGAAEAARSLIADHQARNHPTAHEGRLFSLAYGSQAVMPFSRTALDELAEHAAAKNGLLDVTGYLTYDVDFETFFQFLEGPQLVVEGLMNVISADARHRVLNVVHISEAERQFAAASAAAKLTTGLKADPMPSNAESQRMFSTWRMKLVTRNDFEVMNMGEIVADVLASMRKPELGGEYVTDAILQLSNQLRDRASLASL
ncbi:BLUF domain-containing protein [Lacipirellula parvula]|uniref:BLUF domain-containing protein n=1 Tax=Lacipirellula parvula TaxID=2650471 RepID=A0A5K7XFT0_9BACT|nr:BLUF domain-containing protein [Lacipirellula parvula]BBO35670.1 hypothetical protein PLANPX_5282 [Lacipirellula parvula]